VELTLSRPLAAVLVRQHEMFYDCSMKDESGAPEEQRLFRGISPSAFMRRTRPDEYSDSATKSAFELEASALEQRLDTLTARNQTHDFEIFCRKLCEQTLCPNLKPATGPEGGGDSKADTETIATADEIMTLTYVGSPNAGRERWAFAFSAKRDWSRKARSDIDGLAATGRPYDKVFFVTSQFARAKQRAKLEDDLAKQYGFRVEILDRSWIVEEVVAKDRRHLAVDYLGVGRRVENTRLGPADYARSQQLEDLEKALQDPGAYASMEAQRVTDALIAARLSRELERPRFETDGRFERAIRLADGQAHFFQRLQARYDRLWTAFYWFDDFDLLDREFDGVVDLVLPSTSARDLEKAATLLQSLVNAVVHGHRSAQQLRLTDRTVRLSERLAQMVAEKERPNNALEARTTLLIMRLGQVTSQTEPEALSALWREMSDVLAKAEGLAEYSADRLIQMVGIVGHLGKRDADYSALVDDLADFVSRRVGEGESGLILLNRARQLDIEEDRIELIRVLGRASRQLAKKEYAEGLVEATYLLAVAYRGAGMLWAARATAMFALASTFMEAEGELLPPDTLVPTVMLLGWIDLELRLVAEFLDVIRMVRACRKVLPLDDESDVRVGERLEEFDRAFACKIVNYSATDLEMLDFLPDLLGGLEMVNSQAALLYALGHQEVLLGAEGDPSPSELQDLFEEMARQPAGDIGLWPLVSNDPRPQVMETSVLGMRVRVHASGSVTSLLTSQAVLSVVEAVFATTLAANVGAHVELFEVFVEEQDGLAEPRHTIDEMRMRATLQWPSGVSPASFERPADEALIMLASMIFGVTTASADTIGLIRQLYQSEALAERISTVVASTNGRSRIFNTDISRLSDWAAMSHTSYPLTADYPKIARAKPPSKPSDESASAEMPIHSGYSDHRRIEVRSVLDIPLWERSGWTGLLLGVYGPGRPPIVALHFTDREIGSEIFRRWQTRFGKRDDNGEIHFAILRDLPGHPASHYAALITAGVGQDSGGKLLSTTCRLKTLEPADDTNLRRFLEAYQQVGLYWLAPAAFGPGGQPELMEDLAILKRDLPVKRVRDIGEHELEILGRRLLEPKDEAD
jgi:hypothetical protein